MKKRIIDIIYTSAVFLFTFIIVIQLLTNILFWFNITITPWHLPVELLISIIVTAGIQIFKYKKENQKKNLKKVIVNLIAAIIIGIAIFFIGTFLIGKLYDVTADGNTYHKLGIGSMKNGWNPMYESSRNFTQKDGNVLTVLEDNINYLWADHYAMGTEIIAANIYAFTNKIETGKVFTLIMMYIGFGIILEYLYKQRKWENKKFGLIKSLVISILFVLNPISIVQVGTFYVDATLAISLFIIIIELIATSSNEKSFENYFILAMAIGMCSNAKFTGLGYAAVFCAAFYIYNVIKNRKNKEYIIKQTIFYIVTVIITFGILGSTSYLKNTIVNKHPFYPLYGEGHVENMVNQEIPKSLAAKPNIMQFFISVFSKGENISPSYSTELNEPDLKIPFTVSAEEINNYTIPDIRVGGFGPLYSGIFIITIGVTIALCIDFIKNKKFDSLIIYGIIFGISAVLLIALDGSYWARYVPYAYLISLICLCYLFEKENKVANFIGWIFTIIMIINVGLVFIPASKSYIANRNYVKNNLEAFMEYAEGMDEVPIKLNIHAYQGIQYNLDDLGIKVKLDDEIEGNRDGYMFKY